MISRNKKIVEVILVGRHRALIGRFVDSVGLSDRKIPSTILHTHCSTKPRLHQSSHYYTVLRYRTEQLRQLTGSVSRPLV
jgi:hypothetical protein